MQQLQTERVSISKSGAVQGRGPTARDLVAGLGEIGRLNAAGVHDQAARLYIEVERALGLPRKLDRQGRLDGHERE